ncbi:class I SAM-dependent methyltransferase [Streptomyces sp. NBC_00588]|uniref:class I SAM-dependent methyltransferase n=1 Tax=Streptomyces sp. NBC_00588 TaxID=2975784 RepID=UPI002E8198D4|nr:class I SAM-dependent methyltransferase [Streptomyces sp. NBC_00588]WUB38728.1 class I SAM-dependent methyltransferase [Streptomyces sp. NBC_00588]
MARARGTVAARVPETDEGLQGDELAFKYDEMQRHIRDNGWLQEKVDDILKSGINSGEVLELGCGPGYLGLEWLVQADASARLVGLDISPAMLRRASANADEYGVTARCVYACGTVLALPFEDGRFDHVISASSLHEWADPVTALLEMHRVLKPGGRYVISDLRRDVDRTTFQFMKANIAADMRPGFRTSIQSSYTKSEIEELLHGTVLATAVVTQVQMGNVITGRKDAP